MRSPREQRALVTQLNDKSRKVAREGNKVFVPLKFDDQGNPLTKATFNAAKHLKSLNLNDLHFLKAWRDSGWDTEKACKATLTDPEKAKKLVRKLQVFKDEEERVKALADIPSTPWIAAKHTENVFEGKLDDSQRDSLKELAKIVGAYKPTTNIQLTADLKMPELSADQAKAAREFFDTIAIQESHAA